MGKLIGTYKQGLGTDKRIGSGELRNTIETIMLHKIITKKHIIYTFLQLN